MKPFRRQIVSIIFFSCIFSLLVYAKNSQTYLPQQISSMSLREKLGQLFVVGAYSQPTAEYDAALQTLIKNYSLGGLIFMTGTAQDQIKFTNTYQSIAKIPLFVALDCEWGAGMRLKDIPVFPHAMTMGAIVDDEACYVYGRLIGQQCKRLGVNFAYCPVLDINNNPQNPVINDRSFGENKDKVTKKGLAVLKGIQDEGVLACGKHFCGHGDTSVDSHYDLPVLTKSLEELLSLEIIPFRAAIENGVKAIMVGHLAVPAIDNELHVSAAISKPMTTGILKEKLGFNGLIVTDSLKMNAIKKYFNAAEASKKALIAGNHMLVFNELEQKPEEMFQDITSAIIEIEKAVHAGEISEELVNECVQKNLKMKKWAGLFENKGTVSEPYKDSRLETVATNYFFRSAVTLVKNKNNLLPLATDSLPTIITIGNAKESKLVEQLGQYINLWEMPYPTLTSDDIPEIMNYLQNDETIIVALYGMNKFASKRWGVNDETLELLKTLKAAHKKIILVLFGNPYSLSLFEEEDSIIVGYEEHEDAEIAVADVIRGFLSPIGKLPVTASKQFEEGVGLSL